MIFCSSNVVMSTTLGSRLAARGAPKLRFASPGSSFSPWGMVMKKGDTLGTGWIKKRLCATLGDFGRLWGTLGDSLATLGDSLETFGDRGFKKATIGDRSAKNRRKRRLCSDDAGTMGDTVHYYLSTLRRHVPKITRQVEDLLMTEVCHLLSLLFILVSKMVFTCKIN